MARVPRLIQLEEGNEEVKGNGKKLGEEVLRELGKEVGKKWGLGWSWEVGKEG